MCSGENGRRENWFWKRLGEDESQQGVEVGRRVGGARGVAGRAEAF